MSGIETGTTVRLKIVVKVDGVPADPDTLVVLVKDPVGNVAQPDVVHDSLATYHADFVVEYSGQWRYRWESTGPVSAEEGSFVVSKSQYGSPWINVIGAGPDISEAQIINLVADLSGLSSAIADETAARQSGDEQTLNDAEANTTSAIEDHRAHGVHAEPQPPIIGDGPDEAVAGDDVRLTNKRMSPDNSVTPVQLTQAVMDLFDASGSAADVQEGLDFLSAHAARAFVTVPTQISAYAAAPNQIVPLNTTAGAFTCPLPPGSTLAVGDTVAYRLMAISGANYPTIIASGSDTINGTTQSQQIKLVDQVVSFVWTGTGWIGGFGNKSLASLDARFAPLDSVPTVYQSYVASLVVTNSNLAALAAESGYVWTVVDQNGRIALGIKPDGTLYAPKYSVTGISVSQLASDVLARLTAGNVGSQLQLMPDEQSAYPFAIVDQSGRIALAIDASGHVQAITTISDGAITLAKLATAVQNVLPQALGEESGSVFALVDSIGRAALTVAKDGTISIAKFSLPDGSVAYAKLAPAVTALLPQSLGIESGYAFAVVDQSGHVAFGVDAAGALVARNLSIQDMTSTPAVNADYVVESFVDGSGKRQLRSIDRLTSQVIVLTTAGNNFDPRLTDDNEVLYRSDASGLVTSVYRPAVGGVEYPVTPRLSDGIGCWGDSLTAGAGGSGGGYPTVLASLLGASTYNGGIGGQTSIQIAARQGGAPALVTVSGNTIPTSGPVAVTAISTNLVANSGNPAGSITGTLAGVAGTLTSDGSAAFTFTRASGGSAVTCPPNTPFVATNGLGHQAHMQILWLGRNNYSSGTQVQSDIASCVTYLKTLQKHFLVLSVLNSSGEISGSSNYNQVAALNTALSTAYGGRYIDIRAYLIQHGLSDAGITPTSQDVLDIANDVIPTSLRVDSTHLTQAGYVVVAQQVASKISALGWT